MKSVLTVFGIFTAIMSFVAFITIIDKHDRDSATVVKSMRGSTVVKSMPSTSQPAMPSIDIKNPSNVDGLMTFCVLTVRLGMAGELDKFSGRQIRKGLCLTTLAMTLAVTRRNAYQTMCSEAAKRMYLQFKFRFPKEDEKSVINRC